MWHETSLPLPQQQQQPKVGHGVSPPLRTTAAPQQHPTRCAHHTEKRVASAKRGGRGSSVRWRCALGATASVHRDHLACFDGLLWPSIGRLAVARRVLGQRLPSGPLLELLHSLGEALARPASSTERALDRVEQASDRRRDQRPDVVHEPRRACQTGGTAARQVDEHARVIQDAPGRRFERRGRGRARVLG